MISEEAIMEGLGRENENMATCFKKREENAENVLMRRTLKLKYESALSPPQDKVDFLQHNCDALCLTIFESLVNNDNLGYEEILDFPCYQNLFYNHNPAVDEILLSNSSGENSSLRKFFKSDLKSAVNDVVESEEKSAVNDVVKSDVKSAVNDVFKSDVKSAVNDVVKSDVKSAVNDVVKYDEKSAVNDVIKSDEKSAVNDVVKSDKKSAVNDVVKSDEKSAVNDFKSDVKSAVNDVVIDDKISEVVVSLTDEASGEFQILNCNEAQTKNNDESDEEYTDEEWEKRIRRLERMKRKMSIKMKRTTKKINRYLKRLEQKTNLVRRDLHYIDDSVSSIEFTTTTDDDECDNDSSGKTGSNNGNDEDFATGTGHTNNADPMIDTDTIADSNK